jgi:uncharacterized membrane protein
MKHETVTNASKTTDEKLNEVEQKVASLRERLGRKEHMNRNTNAEFKDNLTFGERVADKVAAFGGSWTFIGIFAAILLLWVAMNSFVLIRADKAFDPFPYILLNLVLSMLAAIQAPVIMMSQNRQSAKDRLEAENDYQVNLKAELEILSIHEKLDDLRDKKWVELMEIQQKQIDALSQLLKSGPADRPA